MESKIAIDVDTSGQPQIRIDYRLTDDLRDKLIGRFLNWLGLPRSRGFWAYVRLGHEYQIKPGDPFDSAVAFIEPLDRKTLSAHMPEIKYALEDEYHKIDIDAPRSSEAPPDIEDEPLICHQCNGTGEGRASGLSCSYCKGTGKEPIKYNQEP